MRLTWSGLENDRSREELEEAGITWISGDDTITPKRASREFEMCIRDSPCIVRKSDGAALYATSDLGTILEREKDFAPDVYKRQVLFAPLAQSSRVIVKCHRFFSFLPVQALFYDSSFNRYALLRH